MKVWTMRPQRLVLTSSYVNVASSLCLLLMVSVTWSGVNVGARDLRAGGNVTDTQVHRWGAEAEGTKLISHMCAAQCNAFCNENTEECERLCRSKIPRHWIMNCHEQETEVYPAYYDSGDSYLTRSSECPGTCSILKDQEEAGYFIPGTPEVVLVRDVVNDSVTLTWSTPDTPSHVVYVVQEKDKNENDWSEAHLVMGADHFTRHDLDVCSRPMYRVAAVSRYGSYWFSDEVTAPDISPDPPQNLQVERIYHDPAIEGFVLTLSWNSPVGWDLQDLRWNSPFSWQNYIMCPPSVNFRPDIFEDKHAFTNNGNTLTFHVADFVIGCKIIYAVTTHSKCSEDLLSERAYLTMDFSCQSVEDLYSGPYCTPPPFNPPGNVKNVRISVFPGMHGARAHVTWSPPSDLGSAGVVGFYTVFYGFIKDTFGFMTFKDNFYQNVTLPGGVTETDIPIAQGNGSGDKFGILVMAGAPGQSIDHPIGFMNEVHATMSDGRVLLDEDIVVYQLEDTREVRVYWSPPSSGMDATGVAIQWGPVSRDLVEVMSDAEGNDVDRMMTYNGTYYREVELRVSNTTVLGENQTTYDIQGLNPSETYGIKVLVLHDGEGEEDIPEDTWRSTRTHVFVMPPHPGGSRSTKSDGRTSRKPHVKLIPASPRPWVAAGVSVAVVVVIVVVMVALWLWCWRRRKHQQLPHLFRLPQSEVRAYSFMPTEGNELAPGRQQAVDDWELPHSALKVGRVLGAGAFGQVLLGRVSRAVLRHEGLPAKHSSAESVDGCALMVPVAIKMLKEGCEDSGKQEFLREIRLMKELGTHRHVVSMLGCCTLREPYCLLVEHMAHGDLLNYLKNLRNTIAQSLEKGGGDHYQNHEAEHFSSMDLLSIARQIALGMEFLADKGYVHRDLAARNVLIGESNEVKIGDFGLARYVYSDRVYVNRKGGKLPLKWMAMESIFDLTFSTASDVWSFGVVLFEIVTLGGTPYPTLQLRDLLKALKEGYRMERPDNCSEEMYSMMRSCWRERPEARPSFLSLRQWLEEIMADTSGVLYLDMELNPARDYYTCQDSLPNSASSSLAESVSLPLSTLFGKDSSLHVDSVGVDGEEGEEKASSGSSAEHAVMTSCKRESMVTSDSVVHEELSPVVSICSSSLSDSPPPSPLMSTVKSVRFSEDTAGALDQHVQKVDSDQERWTRKHSSSSGSENAEWSSAGCDSPLPSPDPVCDEVFTMDLRDKAWHVPGFRLPASSRTGPPRVFPQERHPCSLFRTNATADDSPIGEIHIPALSVMRQRTEPLDSQGESSYASSSSSGESFSLPMVTYELFPQSSPALFLRPVDSCPPERDSRSPSLEVHRQDRLKPVSSLRSHFTRSRPSNVYQQSPSLQRNRNRRVCSFQGKPGQPATFLMGSSGSASLKTGDKDVVRCVAFPKDSADVTAL